ncbi:hypothetical protein ASPZODRAFT_17513 [Penicilliopsis zonata CBS 506.65]|uniref:Major facilitator superfamily (MFS) profile domain-containing protein n=1 Tax=Penicilliopsis zonata CBS 506.65 TaxID=1073090 RepID=A0A1L9SDJ2_9EURO|nr:hypothetical protein ASPZODRAFT_17513 [Penicilliopsis zonata CBS 506.65]OJJ45295.1 hypothetical protein ASPZODRAFT_17513 [Penicilliopsis zonata CBS 506.65]
MDLEKVERQHVEALDGAGVSAKDEKMNLDEIEEFLRAEKEMPLWEAVKNHKRILLISLVSFLCGMTYGYDTIANGTTVAMPSFLLSFGAYDAETESWYAPSVWTSLWTSMSNLGQAVGAFLVGPLAERIGRKYAIVVFSIISFAGVALQFTATSRAQLLGGKIINGLTIGALLAVGTTYASDIAPTRLRGLILQGLVFFSVAMQGTSMGIIRAFVPSLQPSAWKTVFAIQWAVGGLPLLAIFVPESPVWLLSKGRDEDARKSLRQLYGPNKDCDIRYRALVHTLAEEKAARSGDQGSYMECFQGPNLKRTLTASFLMMTSNAVGSGFLSQNVYFLLTVGLSAVDSFDIGIGGFFLGCIAIALGWVYNDAIGRRRLFLIGVAGNALMMVVVGGLGFATSKGSLWAIAIIMNLLISWQVYSIVSISWTLAPEISSYRLRQQTQSISYLVQAISSWFFQFIVPYLYNTGSGDLGAKTGFVFAGLSAICLVVAFFVVPETTGLSVDDIDALYEKGVSPRNFIKYRAQEEH